MAALLALAVLVLGHTSARAALTYSDGDLLLGFRLSTGNHDAFLINLGSASQFTGLAPGATLTFGSISTYGADLTAQFGAGWNTRSDLYWGVFGADSAGLVTIYASKARTVVGTQATAWPTASQSVRNLTQAGIVTVENAFINASTTLGTTTTGSSTTVSTADAGFQTGAAGGRYYSAVATNPDFSTSSVLGGAGIEGSFSGTKVLDLFAINSTSGTSTPALGRFTINGSGVVSFVPEPSTYMLFGIAGVILIAYARRRKAAQQ